MLIHKDSIDDATKLIVIEHRGEKVPFELLGYSRHKSNESVTRIFRDINAYWEWRESIGCGDELDTIFNAYKDISAALFEIRNPKMQYQALVKSVNEIAAAMPVSLVRSWMTSRAGELSKVRHPDDLKEKYEERDKIEQTYLKDEYLELAGLSIVIKFMMPIWGEYYEVIKDYKEVQRDTLALSLIKGSTIAAEESYKRLYQFASCIGDNTKLSNASILNAGLSSESLTEYLFANAICNKLCTTGLSHQMDESDHPDPKKRSAVNLIANLFTQLEVRVKQLESKKENRVQDKKLKDDTKGSDDDNLSIAEQHKPKTILSEGHLVAFDYFMENVKDRAIAVKRDIDLDHVFELFELNLNLNYLNPIDTQIKIVGLITYRCGISPRAIPHINRPGYVGLLSIAQVWLYENKFATIAELLSGSRVSASTTLNSRSVIREEHRTQLEENYTYSKYFKPSGSKAVKRTPGEIAINAIATEFSSYYWETYTTAKIQAESGLITLDKGKQVSRDFRNEVSEFIIKNSNR